MSLTMRCMGTLALLCSGLTAGVAQPPAPNEGIIGIAHIAFRVSDLDREIVFLGKLGYQEAFTLTRDGKITEVFIKINDHQFIELYPQTSPSQPIGWMHVCFEAGDLNVLHKYYVSEGLDLSPVQKASAGNLISSMKDPEGRVTEFIQYMPGSRQTLDRGQHLGVDRVSTSLIGFDLPVREGAAMKELYADFGFEADQENGNVRLTTPGAPDIHIELRSWHPGAQPEFLFAVPDAHRAADELKNAGAKPTRMGKLVFVHDPEGNLFVFLETGDGHKESILPWKH
jgi:catechol 2,3-dioxygenase-like lactoylglutathione lyase family enzyme